jgi:hypothetical protein
MASVKMYSRRDTEIELGMIIVKEERPGIKKMEEERECIEINKKTE